MVQKTSPSPFVRGLGIGTSVILALVALILLNAAYVFFGSAIWDDAGNGEALADPDGYVILGAIFFVPAVCVLVGLWFSIRELVGIRQIQSRAWRAVLAVFSFLFAVLMVGLGIAAALDPIDYYYQDIAWVHPVVASLFLLPGLAGLWFAWSLARGVPGGSN